MKRHAWGEPRSDRGWRAGSALIGASLAFALIVPPCWPALADGGRGGGSTTGVSGGADSATGAGGTGSPGVNDGAIGSGGGGGGAGVTGGAGGNGLNGSAGGTGGAIPGANGADLFTQSHAATAPTSFRDKGPLT